MGRGLPRADDAADQLAFFRFGLRPGVNHKQQNRANKSDGLPAITVRMQVGLRRMERIVKHQHRGFKRQAVTAKQMALVPYRLQKNGPALDLPCGRESARAEVDPRTLSCEQKPGRADYSPSAPIA